MEATDRRPEEFGAVERGLASQGCSTKAGNRGCSRRAFHGRRLLLAVVVAETPASTSSRGVTRTLDLLLKASCDREEAAGGQGVRRACTRGFARSTNGDLDVLLATVYVYEVVPRA